MQQLLAVGLGGFLGAIARYTTSGLADRLILQKFGQYLPAGTFLVNGLGCLIIGSLMALAIEKQWPPEPLRLFLVTGFLGSLTTFSTFGYQSVELFRQGQFAIALGNVAVNVGIGFTAVWLGAMLVKFF